MAASIEKLRKKVQRLVQKRKWHKALALQRQVCQLIPQQHEEWSLLATVAREAAQPQIELAARFEAAKLTSTSAADWLELATRATSYGFESDAFEALFRAADAAALVGDRRLAVELCDRVLTIQPDHRAAKRIMRMCEVRLDDNEPPEADFGSEQEQTGTVTFLRGLAGSGSRPVMSFAPPSTALDTATSWPPVTGPHRAVSRDADADDPPGVQIWPTVLTRSSLLFAGTINELPPVFGPIAEPLELRADELAMEQGKPGHLLVLVDEGELSAWRDAPDHADLGTFRSGMYVGEVGAISASPSGANLVAVTDCKLRVVERSRLRGASDPAARQRIVSLFRAIYIDVLRNICPLLASCPPEIQDEILEAASWSTHKPGELISGMDETDPVKMIVTGTAYIESLSPSPRSLGTLCPGDVIGFHMPSPIQVVAQSLVLVLVWERKTIQELPAEVRQVLASLSDEAANALEAATPAGHTVSA